eukprot:5460187-Karenia_brevis.AAC.1
MAFSAKIRFYLSCKEEIDEQIRDIEQCLHNCPIGKLDFDRASGSCWQSTAIAVDLKRNYEAPKLFDVTHQLLVDTVQAVRTSNGSKPKSYPLCGLQKAVYKACLARLPAPTLVHTLTKRLRARLLHGFVSDHLVNDDDTESSGSSSSECGDDGDLFSSLEFDISRLEEVEWPKVFELLAAAGSHFGISFIKSILNGW